MKKDVPLDPLIVKLETYKSEFSNHVVQDQNKQLKRELWQMNESLKKLEHKYEKLNVATEDIQHDVNKVTAQRNAYK